jgi:DNA-binding NarL/FixJ family response regulator
MSIRIVLVDDHRLFRTGVLTMLADQSDMEVVGEAGSGAEAVTLAADQEPDLVLMDVSMRGMNGIEATRQILAKRPETKILCLSMHREKQFVRAVLEAGASGYLLKDCSLEELALAVHAVMADQSYLSPSVAGVVVADYTAHLAAHADSPIALLTPREREVLQLLAEGRGTADIAEQLHISSKTVGTHREHMMKKLDIHNLAGLTKLAIREGITSADVDPAP